ncbi:MAG: hydroxymethylbilane synthase [Agromyces sp.]
MSTAIRLGTRASQLATTQSQWVARRIEALSGRPVQLVRIASEGDRTSASLASLGGTGVFATALREALLTGECDVIVHSLKDLPTAAAPGLVIGAIPEREPANDALCAERYGSLNELPHGARVGTGSPRRVAQLLQARPDLRVMDIRGNVDTRLGKVSSGEVDAVVLAEAGLRRIGRTDAIAEVFALAAVPTSAGQGALAVEVREGDETMLEILGRLTHPEAHRAALLERAVLANLEAGCAAPVGISVVDGQLIAEVYALDGQRSVRAERALGAREFDRALATELVEELIANGAAEIAPLSPGGASRG